MAIDDLIGINSLGVVLQMKDEIEESDPHYKLYKTALASLRRQLTEVNAALAVTKALDAAPMLWAPYDKYLKEKLSDFPTIHDANRRGEAAQRFFHVAFPKYRPETFVDFARLRRDKRIRQLRDTIINALNTGDVLDSGYPQRVLEGVLKIEKKVRRVRQISGWIGSAIGLVPVPGIGLAVID